jgi:hypothetical protein
MATIPACHLTHPAHLHAIIQVLRNTNIPKHRTHSHTLTCISSPWPLSVQVYVKASAFFRVSSSAPPYADAAHAVRLLVDTFGVERVMWGSDWPWVTEHCGYEGAWGLVDDWGKAADGQVVFSEVERAWLLGGAAKRLLRFA